MQLNYRGMAGAGTIRLMNLIIENQVPLAPLTTLEMGGAARYFCRIESEDQARGALAWARARGLPVAVLGGGSNLLIADAGWPGLVLRIAIPGIEWRESGAARVGAGVVWDELVEQACARGLAGLECLSGIPGSVGAAPVQNIGAYGQEVAETVTRVRALELATGDAVEWSHEECGFGYRRSCFNTRDAGRFVITEVWFALRPGGAATLRYAELERRMRSAGQPPALSATRAMVRELRREKGMLLDPHHPERRTAGSFFKNPIVTGQQWREIARRSPVPPPHWPGEGSESADQVKISAAWLIEQAGFHKGYRLPPAGRVGISSRHALALINYGGATSAELWDLAQSIRDAVRRRWGVQLEPEPVVWE